MFDVPVEEGVVGRSHGGGTQDESPSDRPRAVNGDGVPLVEFGEVEFAYTNGPPVLRGVSFAVERGSMTALVGPSGSGKSTALALIERFYTPTCGMLRYGGTDVRDISRSELRRRIGYVEQEAPVLAGTIADNLRLGAPGATDDELAEVLRLVGLESLVHERGLGLGTLVGDGGVLLSGGQRQRLAWARMILTDPELILLDEPTSSVDSMTEQLLRDALDKIARGRTIIVVAHRLATVLEADQIVVLADGRVEAVGRHRELVERCPLYRELAAGQFLD
jgi:ATP-binding cassette subfamily B protein/ATP-binding cassette subfamily C protein